MSMSARVGITRILVMMSLAAARTSYFSHSSLLTSPPTFSTLKYVTFVQAAGHWSHCWSLHHTRLLVYTSWQQSTHLRHSTLRTHTGLLPGPAQTAPCWLPVFTQAAYTVQYTVHCTPVHCTPGQLTPGPAHTWAHCPHTREHCVIWSSSHQLSQGCHPVHCMLKLNICAEKRF